MNRKVFAYAGAIALWLNGGFACAQELTEALAKELEKHGINRAFGRSGFPKWGARLDASGTDFRKAAELLPRFKDLEAITLHLGSSKLADEHIKLMKALPNVEDFAVEANQLSKEDIQKIATLDKLRELTLESREISIPNLKPLTALKKLQRLHLASANQLPRAAVAEFEKALPKGAIVSTDRVPDIIYVPLLEVAANDSPLTSLKKQKYNAALSAVKEYLKKVRAGREGATFGNLDFLEAMRKFKDAGLEVAGSHADRIKIYDHYVEVAKYAYEEVRTKAELGVKGVDDFYVHRAHYDYLDAEIQRLQLKMQAEKK
jgi:hypothetical protein